MDVLSAPKTCGDRSFGPTSDGVVVVHGPVRLGLWTCYGHYHRIVELERRGGDWFVSVICGHMHRSEETARRCLQGGEG